MRRVIPWLGKRPRQEQVDYLVRRGPSRMLFIPPTELGNSYPGFPKNEYLKAFSQSSVRPENAGRDLLALMIEEYVRITGRDPSSIVRWVEKTPDNAYCFPRIQRMFPEAKMLIMIRIPGGFFSPSGACQKDREAIFRESIRSGVGCRRPPCCVPARNCSTLRLSFDSKIWPKIPMPKREGSQQLPGHRMGSGAYEPDQGRTVMGREFRFPQRFYRRGQDAD